jgi:hypothetical protein
MIDKFGAPMSQGRDCQVTNVLINANGASGDLVCSGRIAGKGTWEATWSNPEHARDKSHLVGTVQMGQRTAPIEFTKNSTWVYKSSDCGSVQPPPMPNN